MLYVIVIALSIIWAIPILWALATSLKPDPETTVAPAKWFGSVVTFDAYGKIIDEGEIGKWYFNSLLTATVITAARWSGIIGAGSSACMRSSRGRRP